MTRADFHVHTTYCDGKGTPEEMVRAAIAMGLRAVGFSGHSRTAFDESWCMSEAGTAAYRAEIARLKAAYAGKIDVRCGVEQDLLSGKSAAGWDYVIGSVHWLDVGGTYVPVDESAKDLKRAAKQHFGGDMYALIEAYYASVARVQAVTGCGVVGHFDLITKFNEGAQLFDETHPRYVAAWKRAADALVPTGALFEINTGAIARGWRTAPYPSAAILDDLVSRGARFLLSGDAHAPGGLCFEFDRWDAWARARGAVIAESPDFCIH